MYAQKSTCSDVLWCFCIFFPYVLRWWVLLNVQLQANATKSLINSLCLSQNEIKRNKMIIAAWLVNTVAF